MRAIEIPTRGGPLTLVDCPPPNPGRGERMMKGDSRLRMVLQIAP